MMLQTESCKLYYMYNAKNTLNALQSRKRNSKLREKGLTCNDFVKCTTLRLVAPYAANLHRKNNDLLSSFFQAQWLASALHGYLKNGYSIDTTFNMDLCA